MFKLVIADDEGKSTVVPLVRDEISIGRKEGNTIRLTERNVSRKHARLRRSNGAFSIEDLSSFTGVKVNGRRIGGELQLHAGDQITIGDYQLALQAEGADANATMPETTAPLGAAAAAPDAVTALIAAPGAVTGPPARLVMLSPPAPGQEFALNRPRMRLGRAEDLDLWVNHRSISREHAEFQVEGDAFRVIDLGSSNGLRVNGQEKRSHDLVPGDVIEIGQVKLRFVAPGEVFTFDEGRTMQMDALGDLATPAANRTPMFVAAGIVGLALLGGVAVAVSGSGDPEEPTVTAITPVAAPVPPAPLAAPAAAVGPAPTVDIHSLVASCRTSLNSGNFDAALASAHAALAASPGEPTATACRDDATTARTESETFATGLSALNSGDLSSAYMSFETLGASSPYRSRAEFARVMSDFASTNLRTAETLVGSDPVEATRLATMVLAMSMLDDSGRARAEAVVRRARPAGGRVAIAATPTRPVPAAPGGTREGPAASRPATERGAGTGGGAAPAAGGSTGPSASPPAAGGGEASRYDRARTCSIAGDNRCVVTELRGHCSQARDYELLIIAMRQLGGMDRDVEGHMRTYLDRFPSGRMAAQYRQYLVAHSGG
jgi:pSer/pThr/pTyr-binding forkhead associated (FHA) protein